ncbi:Kunitz/Bovine pancreatic trypsin inhibitor domain protein [Necator americanus]|uniref:Kunitz/Bovine pancreatic trypsin inhibitor domain protein n=1 Tax=Necator americanus TaxID=51031 RepID=W2TU03_NECAM|nr:Kunitz/Bovine pancreatic trypsin inhibitor domain protein [Necator americanus]ETN84537.1 Kunitz/Bovine pancreatic trypsin inhibitor domain protein [Necator americanus]
MNRLANLGSPKDELDQTYGTVAPIGNELRSVEVKDLAATGPTTTQVFTTTTLDAIRREEPVKITNPPKNPTTREITTTIASSTTSTEQSKTISTTTPLITTEDSPSPTTTTEEFSRTTTTSNTPVTVPEATTTTTSAPSTTYRSSTTSASDPPTPTMTTTTATLSTKYGTTITTTTRRITASPSTAYTPEQTSIVQAVTTSTTVTTPQTPATVAPRTDLVNFIKITNRIQRFAFDTESGECRPFTYGGCGGNGNNFATLAECRIKCQKVALSPGNLCEHDIEVGECSGVFVRFGYDHSSNDCRQFTYGGCGGNGNNFATIQECRNVCVKKLCDVFTYTGCQGNGNNYASREECLAICHKEGQETARQTVTPPQSTQTSQLSSGSPRPPATPTNVGPPAGPTTTRVAPPGTGSNRVLNRQDQMTVPSHPLHVHETELAITDPLLSSRHTFGPQVDSEPHHNPPVLQREPKQFIKDSSPQVVKAPPPPLQSSNRNLGRSESSPTNSRSRPLPALTTDKLPFDLPHSVRAHAASGVNFEKKSKIASTTYYPETYEVWGIDLNRHQGSIVESKQRKQTLESQPSSTSSRAFSAQNVQVATDRKHLVLNVVQPTVSGNKQQSEATNPQSTLTVPKRPYDHRKLTTTEIRDAQETNLASSQPRSSPESDQMTVPSHPLHVHETELAITDPLLSSRHTFGPQVDSEPHHNPPVLQREPKQFIKDSSPQGVKAPPPPLHQSSNRNLGRSESSPTNSRSRPLPALTTDKLPFDLPHNVRAHAASGVNFEKKSKIASTTYYPETYEVWGIDLNRHQGSVVESKQRKQTPESQPSSTSSRAFSAQNVQIATDRKNLVLDVVQPPVYTDKQQSEVTNLQSTLTVPKRPYYHRKPTTEMSDAQKTNLASSQPRSSPESEGSVRSGTAQGANMHHRFHASPYSKSENTLRISGATTDSTTVQPRHHTESIRSSSAPHIAFRGKSQLSTGSGLEEVPLKTLKALPADAHLLPENVQEPRNHILQEELRANAEDLNPRTVEKLAKTAPRQFSTATHPRSYTMNSINAYNPQQNNNLAGLSPPVDPTYFTYNSQNLGSNHNRQLAVNTVPFDKQLPLEGSRWIQQNNMPQARAMAPQMFSFLVPDQSRFQQNPSMLKQEVFLEQQQQPNSALRAPVVNPVQLRSEAKENVHTQSSSGQENKHPPEIPAQWSGVGVNRASVVPPQFGRQGGDVRTTSTLQNSLVTAQRPDQVKPVDPSFNKDLQASRSAVHQDNPRFPTSHFEKTMVSQTEGVSSLSRNSATQNVHDRRGTASNQQTQSSSVQQNAAKQTGFVRGENTSNIQDQQRVKHLQQPPTHVQDEATRQSHALRASAVSSEHPSLQYPSTVKYTQSEKHVPHAKEESHSTPRTEFPKRYIENNQMIVTLTGRTPSRVEEEIAKTRAEWIDSDVPKKEVATTRTREVIVPVLIEENEEIGAGSDRSKFIFYNGDYYAPTIPGVRVPRPDLASSIHKLPVDNGPTEEMFREFQQRSREFQNAVPLVNAARSAIEARRKETDTAPVDIMDKTVYLKQEASIVNAPPVRVPDKKPRKLQELSEHFTYNDNDNDYPVFLRAPPPNSTGTPRSQQTPKHTSFIQHLMYDNFLYHMQVANNTFTDSNTNDRRQDDHSPNFSDRSINIKPIGTITGVVSDDGEEDEEVGVVEEVPRRAAGVTQVRPKEPIKVDSQSPTPFLREISSHSHSAHGKKIASVPVIPVEGMLSTASTEVTQEETHEQNTMGKTIRPQTITGQRVSRTTQRSTQGSTEARSAATTTTFTPTTKTTTTTSTSTTITEDATTSTSTDESTIASLDGSLNTSSNTKETSHSIAESHTSETPSTRMFKSANREPSSNTSIQFTPPAEQEEVTAPVSVDDSSDDEEMSIDEESEAHSTDSPSSTLSSFSVSSAVTDDLPIASTTPMDSLENAVHSISDSTTAPSVSGISSFTRIPDITETPGSVDLSTILSTPAQSSVSSSASNEISTSVEEIPLTASTNPFTEVVTTETEVTRTFPTTTTAIAEVTTTVTVKPGLKKPNNILVDPLEISFSNDGHPKEELRRTSEVSLSNEGHPKEELRRTSEISFGNEGHPKEELRKTSEISFNNDRYLKEEPKKTEIVDPSSPLSAPPQTERRPLPRPTTNTVIDSRTQTLRKIEILPKAISHTVVPTTVKVTVESTTFVSAPVSTSALNEKNVKNLEEIENSASSWGESASEEIHGYPVGREPVPSSPTGIGRNMANLDIDDLEASTVAIETTTEKRRDETTAQSYNTVPAQHNTVPTITTTETATTSTPLVITARVTAPPMTTRVSALERITSNSQIVCTLPPDAGTCFEYVPRWFFNAHSGQCEQFSYGSCGGNENNFMDRASCELKCLQANNAILSHVPDRCAYEKNSGFGDGYNVKWHAYFNMRNLRCEQFVYEGKGGNENQFETLSDCERICSPQPPSFASVIKTTFEPTRPPAPITAAPKVLHPIEEVGDETSQTIDEEDLDYDKELFPSLSSSTSPAVISPGVSNSIDNRVGVIPRTAPLPPIPEGTQRPGTEPHPPAVQAAKTVIHDEQPVELPTINVISDEKKKEVYKADPLPSKPDTSTNEALPIVGASPPMSVNYQTGEVKNKASGIRTFHESTGVLTVEDLDLTEGDPSKRRDSLSCPNGLQEIRYADGRPVMCLPGKNQCPENAVCYFNGVDFFCCPNEEDPYDKHIFGGYDGEETKHGYKVFGPLNIRRLMDDVVPSRTRRQSISDRRKRQTSADNVVNTSFNIDSVIAPLRFDDEKPRQVSRAQRMRTKPVPPNHGNPICIEPPVTGDCGAAHLRYELEAIVGINTMNQIEIGSLLQLSVYYRYSDTTTTAILTPVGCSTTPAARATIITLVASLTVKDCAFSEDNPARTVAVLGPRSESGTSPLPAPAQLHPGQCPGGKAPLGGSAPVLCGNSNDSIGCPAGFTCITGPPDVCCPNTEPAQKEEKKPVRFAPEVPGVPRAHSRKAHLTTPKFMCPDASDPLMGSNHEPTPCGAGFDGMKLCPQGFYCAIDAEKQYIEVTTASVEEDIGDFGDESEEEEEDSMAHLMLKPVETSPASNADTTSIPTAPTAETVTVNTVAVPNEALKTEESTTTKEAVDDASICQIKPSEGRACRDNEKPPRTNLHYFYSAKDRRCKLYFYRGCGGNANRFEKKADCEKLCLH